MRSDEIRLDQIGSRGLQVCTCVPFLKLVDFLELVTSSGSCRDRVRIRIRTAAAELVCAKKQLDRSTVFLSLFCLCRGLSLWVCSLSRLPLYLSLGSLGGPAHHHRTSNIATSNFRSVRSPSGVSFKKKHRSSGSAPATRTTTTISRLELVWAGTRTPQHSTGQDRIGRDRTPDTTAHGHEREHHHRGRDTATVTATPRETEPVPGCLC